MMFVMQCRPALLVIAMLALVASPVVAQTRSRPTDRLDWLSGCWRSTANNRVVEEQWSLPRAGMMFGVGRTIHRDSTVSFEMMRIMDRRGILIFEARPDGATPVEFTGRRTPRTIVFTNTSNDFPQRVGYNNVGPDSLEAFIDGTIRGRTRRIDYAYRRVACESPRDSATTR